MNKHRFSATSVLVMVLIAITLLISRATMAVLAQEPTDGRINKVPWVNSYGAVAVYCVDQSGHAGGSFTGGGISVLNASGQQVLFASEAAINASIARANQINDSSVILRKSVYSLIARPGNYLMLVSVPDAEGKTFLGEWQNCAAVGSEATAMPGTLVPSACVPKFIRNEADSGFACGNCYNGIDDDCNGKTDAQDFSCQYYCFQPR